MTTVDAVRDLWVTDAACRGSVLFVTSLHGSTDERRARERAAKKVCADCPVQRPCLDYALRVIEPLGIWGGLSETERRDLRDLLPTGY